MAEILVTILIMVLCLICEGFFSGSEIGVISADRAKLRQQAAKGSRGAKLALSMLKKPEWLLSTTLIGTNIAVVTNTTIATALMIQLFGEKGSLLAIVLVAPLIWVFGEIVPKSVFQQKANVLTPKVIFVLKFFSYLFFPVLVVFSFLARLLSRLAGTKPEGENPFTLREEIMTMIQMSPDKADIELHEQKMIRQLFDFGETSAREIMVPLVDVICIEQGTDCEEAQRLARERAHKRLPVYAKRVDKIVGMLNTLDLLGVDPDAPIKPFIKPVDYVPGSRRIQDLLLDLRRDGNMMAVVVDEFGGGDGIVTVEDIVEEVVEDIQDEYDDKEEPVQWFRKIAEREYMVSARVDLDTLSEEIGIDLPAGNYASLGGFLLDKSQDIPKVGDVIGYKESSFTITDASPQAIQEIRVRW
ncbi:MAG: HlyC/CorC family transporter [Gammaproteobacteria bacterium]|nr:HlyC/CorC family transporter [Gammaproteobacteria bacterium]